MLKTELKKFKKCRKKNGKYFNKIFCFLQNYEKME